MKKKNIGQIDQRPIQEAIEEFICFNIKWSKHRFIRTLYNLISSISFVIKCYSQILWLPKIIKGYEYLLSAEKQFHKHYKKIAEHKTQQVEDIMSETVADLVFNIHTEDESDESVERFNQLMKEEYQRWNLEVPDEYMTQEDHQKWFDDHYDRWLFSCGEGDLSDVYWDKAEGKKLLDGFNVREEI